MIYKDISLSSKITLIKTAIDKAEAVIIGAGSGLSTAAGLRYVDSDFFNATFPGYHDCYGLRTTNEADFFQFSTPEEQYAYWTRHITAVRYNYPAGKPYLDLFSIIKDKPYFVLTTNTDGQFLKSGFDPTKICFPPGRPCLFQCSRPCNDTIYPQRCPKHFSCKRCPIVRDSFKNRRFTVKSAAWKQ